MANLLNLQTGEEVLLLAHHLFGRHPAASNTLLSNPDISRMHASVFWDGEYWLLQDTSTNGTFVNNARLTRDAKFRLHKNDKIHFGNPNADTWQLNDVDAPRSVLVAETQGFPSIYLDDIAVLPNEEEPEVTLYQSPLGQWLCESQSGTCVLSSGDLVGTDHCTWRFIEAKTCAETICLDTQAPSDSSAVEIHFEVSQNEEHVALRFVLDDQSFDLGERNHHYLLLLLARQRLADKNASDNIDESEQGWVEKEQLSRMLGQSETHINIQVYRFRKQIIKALPSELILPQVIERRSGEIRFVYDNIHISGGMHNITPKSRDNQVAL